MLLCRLLPLRPVVVNNLFLDDPKLSNVQIFALEPWTSSAPVVLSPTNGNLKSVYLLQRDEKPSSSSSNSQVNVYTDSNSNQYSTRPSRGRSFSPPKRTTDSSSQSDRFITISNSYKNETKIVDGLPNYVKKSSSSDQIRFIPKTNTSFSSASTSSSVSDSLRENTWPKSLKSGIPVPISSDGRLRLRTRTTEVHKGPMSTPARFYRAKSPSPILTPEKCLIPQKAIIARQQFSSGSESSDFYTPPAEPHLAFAKQTQERPPPLPPETERFLQVSTEENDYTILDNTSVETVKIPSRLERSETTFDQEDPPQAREDFFEIVPPKLERQNTTFSVDSLDCASTKPNDTTCLSKSEVDLLNPTSVMARKEVNSAPTLIANSSNETSLDSCTTSCVKTSLPGSIDDLQGDDVKEVVEQKAAKAVKVPSKKFNQPKLLTRRNSTRSSKKGTPEAMKPFCKPKEALQEILAQLESSDWEITMIGLQGVSRLTKFHKEETEANLHPVCVGVGRHIRNLRSQVARAACKVASDLFNNHRRALEMDLDELAVPLLHRTADTNKFLRGDANSALDKMSLYITPSRVVAVTSCKGAGHQNAVVRCAAVRILCELTQRLGIDRVFQLPRETRDKIICTGATMLMEGNLETRKHAKTMLGLLAHHGQFGKAIVEAVPGTTMRHIQKSLQTLK